MATHFTPVLQRLRTGALQYGRLNALDILLLIDTIEQLAAEVQNLRRQMKAVGVVAVRPLEQIKQATIEGRVCDDVAWFDTVTTLHDFCELEIARITGIDQLPEAT